MDNTPHHGKLGWMLVDYEYNEETGMARHLYRRGPERKTVNRQHHVRYFDTFFEGLKTVEDVRQWQDAQMGRGR